MLFSTQRHELAAQAVNKAASAGGSRLQNSGFAKTVLAPVLANRFPYIITPYLGLRAKLSQVWLNRWTILLLLVLVRLLIAVAGLGDDINSARREALSACGGVEGVGSAIASMPHYMAQGVNELTADGVERAINGLMSMLLYTVTGVEEIVVFVINMLTSTYLCLITLVVRGSLHAAIALIEQVEKWLNDALANVGGDIHSAVEDFQSAYNSFVSGLDDIGSIFGGGDDSIPKLDISKQLDELNSLQIPSGLDADLQKLNQNIPTFAEVQNFTTSVIEWPFEEIKKLINESLPNYKFDRNVFPVPAKEQMLFCSDGNGIDDFFDHLLELNDTARKVGTAALLVLAVLVAGPMAWREIHSHRKMQERAEVLREGATAPIDATYIVTRPFTAGAGLKAAAAFDSPRRQSLVRWAIAYATTVPALFVLSLGVAGLFSCLSRWIVLKVVEQEVPELVNEVSGFADKVIESLNHASADWANGTNAVILEKGNQINNDVFGWVNTSTHAVNQTLNVFVDKSIDALKDAFGGTVLYGPVKELFNCLIGLKVTAIEKGLTWVHDHAHIDFPLLPNNTFSLGAAAAVAGNSDASSFLANPSSGTTDEITSIVNALVQKFTNSIYTETLISASLIGVWVVVALMGICRAAWLFFRNGHMPEDYGLNGNDEPKIGEKSPSFVGTGEYFGSPRNAQQANEFEKVPEVALRPPSPPHHNAGADPNLPEYLEVPIRGSMGNEYRGQPYTITTRPFPKGGEYPDGEKPDIPPPPFNDSAGYRRDANAQRATMQTNFSRSSSYTAF